jgi:uncharacterized membrane protein YhaH (DUF805 family)
MLDYLIQPVRRSLDFRGRARRSEYWGFVLWQLAFLAVVLNFLTLFPPEYRSAEITAYVLMVHILLFGLPTTALQVRRLHDQGASGWMIIVTLTPYIGVGWLFWMMVSAGTQGPNRYGDDPRSVGFDEALFE